MKILLLWLEAPLQSWGVDSRYGRRDTLPFPTRSGVLGLLCCAMGRGGEQREWLATMKPFRQSLVAYARKRKGGTEAQPVSLLCDFHMVGSGYDSSDPWQDMLIPKKADGKRPVGSGTKLTYRYYLQDMAFACALEMPEQLLEEAVAGLQVPVWPICLGRKSCVPAAAVYRGTFDSEEAALAHAADIAAEGERTAVFRVLPGEHEEGDTLTLNDVPLNFGLRKKYEDRMVSVIDAEQPHHDADSSNQG